MVRISFEGFEFAFKCFESLLSGLNFNSNASNPFQMVGFALKRFESLSNGLNLLSNLSYPFRMVRI